MIQTIIHTTENNNCYIYDDQSRLSILIHPELKKAHENAEDVNPYYLKKYGYLKEHGFFTETKLPQFEKLDEANVLDSIIKTTQIIFEVTDSCNLNCVYCGYGELFQAFNERGHNNLNISNATKLIKYIFDLKIKSNKNKLMIGFYGGEPLLNINFIRQIIEVINQLNAENILDIEYSMTTNATLIHRHIDFLILNNIYLTVSLDGNKINHSYRVFKNTKENSFIKVIKNIDLIQKKHPDYFDKYINFISVLHDRNSVKEIYEFIYTRYLKIPTIIELNTSDSKPDKKDILEKMFHSKMESETEYQREDYLKISETRHETSFFHELTNFIKHNNINCYISNKTALFNVDEFFLPTGTCSPFSLKIFLTTHNKLLPCEKINFKYAIGEINENVHINFKEIAKKYNLYFEHATRICQHCYNYKFCGSCIFHFSNLDKLDIEDLVCDFFQDQQSFEKYLYRIFSYFEKNTKDFFYILENTN